MGRSIPARCTPLGTSTRPSATPATRFQAASSPRSSDMIPARRCLVLSALALPALVACGGPGSFDGTVNGITMSVKDAVFLTPKDGNGNVVGLVLSMSDQPGLCASLQAQQVVHDSTNFVASLSEFSGGGQVPPTPGDFPVYNGSTP